MQYQRIVALIGFCCGSAFGQLNIGQPLSIGEPLPPPASATCANQIITMTTGTTRSDAYWVGFDFTVGASNITVCQLARQVVSGDSRSHTVTLFDASGVIVSGSVNTAGLAAGDYAVVSVPDTVLPAGSRYILAVDETVGDNWYTSHAITITNSISLNHMAYSPTTPTLMFSFVEQDPSNDIYSSPNAFFH